MDTRILEKLSVISTAHVPTKVDKLDICKQLPKGFCFALFSLQVNDIRSKFAREGLLQLKRERQNVNLSQNLMLFQVLFNQQHLHPFQYCQISSRNKDLAKLDEDFHKNFTHQSSIRSPLGVL